MNVSPPLHAEYCNTTLKGYEGCKDWLTYCNALYAFSTTEYLDNTIPQIMLKGLEIPWETAAGSFCPAVTRGN